MQFACVLPLIAGIVLLLVQGAPRAQDLSATYQRLAHAPVGVDELLRTCGTPTDHALRGEMAVGQSMADGKAIRAEQFPRFLRPNHDGEFGFNGFTVLGDHETVMFERHVLSQTVSGTVETWDRIGTSAVAGRLTSIFRPVWTAETLRVVLSQQRWGVDRPNVLLGHVVSPGTTRQPVYLQLVPPNLPSSEVVQLSETVQFASHAVNLWIPDFGDARVQGGKKAWRLRALARTFYQHFSDAYETLAVVTQSQELTDALGFHRNVRNNVAGIGLDLFDDSAQYGSASVLQGVELFPSARWAENATGLHQQAHQWSEYSGAWAAAGLVRRGDVPLTHTPLLTPGAVMAGAVLEPTRRVEYAPGAGGGTIERTLPTIRYSGLTLYRMGLVEPRALPTYLVFEDQGQFGFDQRVAPDPGMVVQGGTIAVTPDGFIVTDGLRNGPSVTRLRRAVVYVSRTGLASQREMDAVNFFAARLAAREGVTSWDGYPSFSGATGGQAELDSQITPLAMPAIDAVTNITYFPVAPDALVGVLLDRPLPGRIPVGQTIRVNGTLTLTDRADYNIFCLRFFRYGSVNINQTFVCGSLSGRRFSIPVTFTARQQGRYTIEPFAFWTNSGPQGARSRYGAIVVGEVAQLAGVGIGPSSIPRR